MTTLLGATIDAKTEPAPRPTSRPVGRRWSRYNWLAGLAGWFWLAVILIPLYWIVITSFKEQSD